MTQLLPRWLQPIGLPLAPLYERLVRARNRRFDAGRGIARIDRPVISIGNITVGGTGKTPVVMWVARELQHAGHHPCIAMRGYGAKRGEIGDEQAEYGEALRDVPVVADPDRHAALLAQLPTMPTVDCVLLDDGFQHRQLHRDLDIVLLDASRDTMHDRMLPAGSLREPLSGLARADAVIVTRADSIDDAALDQLSQHIARHHRRAPLACCRHRWQGLMICEAGELREAGIDWLDGRSVITMLGVGNPRAIERQLEEHGAKIVRSIPASDHERYDRLKLDAARDLAGTANATFLTRKDWVKVRQLIDLNDWPTPIVVPNLEIDFLTGEDLLRTMILKHLSTDH